MEERNSSAGEGQKAEQEEGFLRKGTELTSGQIAHNIFPSACTCLQAPLDGGFIFKESDSVHEGVRQEIKAPKAKSAPSSLNIFGIIY